jgi:hypothetical protein
MGLIGFFTKISRGAFAPRGVWFCIAAGLGALTSYDTALSQEIHGPCSQAVGTFLTTNEVHKDGEKATSRSVIALTNGGHALRFDSDESGAKLDRRAFGDSAGIWRCDGVADDGTVRMTATMIDFTFPAADGDKPQIARMDVSGRYVPTSETLELEGELGFLPMTAEAQKPDALSADPSPKIALSIRGKKIELPPAR